MKSDKEPDTKTKSTEPTDSPKHRRVYARPPVDGGDEELEAWAEEFFKALMSSEEGKPQDSHKGRETP